MYSCIFKLKYTYGIQGYTADKWCCIECDNKINSNSIKKYLNLKFENIADFEVTILANFEKTNYDVALLDIQLLVENDIVTVIFVKSNFLLTTENVNATIEYREERKREIERLNNDKLFIDNEIDKLAAQVEKLSTCIPSEESYKEDKSKCIIM